jgi:membrane protein required for colicin V production
MNALDYTILVVMGLSALVGLLRGFVRETVSLLVWIAAFWLAMTYGAVVAERLSGFIHQPSLRVAAAFAALFALVLLAGVVINYLLASLLKRAGLRISDRLLGVIFGLVRGGLVVGLVMVLVELTPLVQSAGWRESMIVGLVQPMLTHVHKLLPSDLHATVAQEFGVFSR